MTKLDYLCRITLFFGCLIFANTIIAGQIICSYLDLSAEQLQVYEQNNIKILGALQLDRYTENENQLAEFSGLAWDHDQNLLYALSDRGYLIHLQPIFDKDKLVNVELEAYYLLKDVHGKNLVHKFADSEGLALVNSNNNKQNDTELIVSFERVPRIIRYTVDGDFISNTPIHNVLNNIQNYSSPNKALEAITTHDKFKVITGPERPLVNSAQNVLSLYTLGDAQWSFKPGNENYSSLVGLTTLPDNRVIALERLFPGILAGVSNIIHLITLKDNMLEQKELVKINPSDGYFNENFEGITWHKENRFFMISDDNNNLFQRTILMYFEIMNLD